MNLFMLWEFFVNLIQSTLIYFLFRNILKHKTFWKKKNFSICLGITIQTIFISTTNFMLIPFEISIIIVAIIIFSYSLIFFQSSISKKFFASMLSIFSSFLSDFLVSRLHVLFPFLSKIDYEDAVNWGEARIYFTLLYLAIISLIYFFIISFNRYIKKEVHFNWILTISIVSVLICTVLILEQILALSFISKSNSFHPDVNISLIGFAFLITLLAFVLMIWQSGIDKQRAVDYAILVQQNNFERKNYQEMEKFIEEYKIEKHNYEHHLNTITTLAKNNDHKSIIEYCSENLGYIKQNTIVHYTGNSLLDAVLTTQNAVARSSCINFSVSIFSFDTLPLSNFELCSIVHNLLSNAITASMRLSQSQREIQFEMKRIRGMFLISATNNCDGQYIISDGKLQSMKKEDGHGFGLKTVEKIALLYGGFLDIHAQESQFVAKVLFPIKTN